VKGASGWRATVNSGHYLAVIGGKGRYAGAKADGIWEAVVTRGPGSIQVIDNVVNIKK
jgi:hypothetical protein